jgi:peptidoglycan/LPS O-acetylase OafA/YrhL
MVYLSAIAAPAQAISRVLGHPLLCFFGRYSYGIYIIHMPVGQFLFEGRGARWGLFGSWQGTLAGSLCQLVVAGALTVGLALISWNVWEKHFLRLKPRLG